jgi:hypothetical protein
MVKNIAKDFEQMWNTANKKALETIELSDRKTEPEVIFTAQNIRREEYLKMMLSMYHFINYEDRKSGSLIDNGPNE